jgi:hypothetical protein
LLHLAVGHHGPAPGIDGDSECQRIGELRGNAAVRAEITTASLIEQAEQVFQKAMEAKQFSAAVAALREKAILAGKRVERAEKGEPGQFDKLSEEQINKLLAQEMRLIEEAKRHRPAANGDDTAEDSAKASVPSAQPSSGTDEGCEKLNHARLPGDSTAARYPHQSSPK